LDFRPFNSITLNFWEEIMVLFFQKVVKAKPPVDTSIRLEAFSFRG
jgi:hypothetical protein